MSCPAGVLWFENQVETIEDLFNMPFTIFDNASEIEKFKMLSQMDPQDAAKVIKIYYDLASYGYIDKTKGI